MPATRRRTAAKLIRFHPDELVRITDRSRDCGRTPTRFIRETALGAVPRPRHHAATEALLRDLARIGGCLERIARLARASHHAALAEQACAALDLHGALVRQIVQDDKVQSGADLAPSEGLTTYHRGA
jgi:hypothetical protein